MTKDELLNKISIQKSLHSYYEMKYKPISIFIRLAMLIIPSVITFLSVADINYLKYLFSFENRDQVLLPISLLSFLLFIIAIIMDVFGIQTKYKDHREVIHKLIKMKDEYLNNSEVKGANENQITKHYREIYLQIVQNSPEFTDKEYARGKKYHDKTHP